VYKNGGEEEDDENQDEENEAEEKQTNKIIRHNLNSCSSLFFSRFVGCKPFFDGVKVRRVSKASAVINK